CNVSVFHSSPVRERYPNHLPVLRLMSSCIDITLTNRNFRLDINLGSPATSVNLLHLVAAAHIQFLRDRAHRRGGLFCLTIAIPQGSWATMGKGRFNIPEWKRVIYKAATDAHDVIRRFNGTPEQTVTAASLIQQRNSIAFMRALIYQARDSL